jgi:hypothetical protein
MKIWWETSLRDLEDKYLLDEHRTIHAYFGAMKKDLDKWKTHALYKNWDPVAVFVRHLLQEVEFERRGFNHQTPVSYEEVKRCFDK